MQRIVVTFLIIIMPSLAEACNVPVFRYALERWQPDLADVIIFHNGTLSREETSFINSLERASVENNGVTNIRVVRQHVDHLKNDSLTELWKSLQDDPNTPLPCVVVRSRVARGQLVNNWYGTIQQAMTSGLLQSPVRRELSRRLYQGDSAVWLVLKSNDEQRNRDIVNLLKQQLKVLSKKIPLPEGVGLPGSELFSEIPLLMKFSVLEIDPGDKKEQLLVRLLHGLSPESKKSGEPLVVPVFGRGRALEVIPADQVDAGLIEDLTLFLCGACSCQVKEQNPGFDLLLSADWKKELFGENADELVPHTTNTSRGTPGPVLLTIPPGKQSKPQK